jgi:hypothetical protein
VTKAHVRNVASAGFEKWLLVALATLALSAVFLWRGGAWATWVGGGLFLLYLSVGALTLWGLLGSRPKLVAAGFGLSFVGVAVIALVFTRWPAWVAERL